MQNNPEHRRKPLRPARANANVTAAIGMEETIGRRKARSHFLFTRTVLGLTALVCLALLLATFVQAWSNSALLQKVQDAQSDLQQKQSQHSQLQTGTEHYKDPQVIESEARQRLGYVRPGEKAVIIVPAEAPQTAAKSPVSADQHKQGYWADWWQLFFGH
ncbi:FtsB family cell division protein [Tengunoibacter tsumagoiensis]|uniref:Septum formation initiator n=1 Tax=Tengunoibacter tsumagoiensis TaxID=2014871 RepID=A0A401ZW19_9CHLR|nr:septum formation initiator family protein [Tengunoibacter tsumagoiensis]GCE11099.1 hypothetical protein KTT_09580 [Tengunoibacter tsumagoiensis]